MTTVIDTIIHPTHGTLMLEESGDHVSISTRTTTIHRDKSKSRVFKEWARVKHEVLKSLISEQIDLTPASADFSWISNYDISEVKVAIDKIVDYMPSVSDSTEHLHLLRNDIRILDNLVAALKSKKSAEIERCWTICHTQGCDDHLHDEFVSRMNDSIAKTKRNAKGDVTTSERAWIDECIRLGLTVKGEQVKQAVNERGDMMAGWSRGIGWVYQPLTEQEDDALSTNKTVVLEKSPPGMEDWVISNKASFKQRYGKDWEQALYATAWAMYNRSHEQHQR